MGPIRSEYANDPGMREIVEAFVQEMPNRIRALEDAFGAGAQTDLRRLAHQMKGSCGGYGFGTVGEAAGRLEASLDANAELSSLKGQLDELVSMCSRVIV